MRAWARRPTAEHARRPPPGGLGQQFPEHRRRFFSLEREVGRGVPPCHAHAAARAPDRLCDRPEDRRPIDQHLDRASVPRRGRLPTPRRTVARLQRVQTPEAAEAIAMVRDQRSLYGTPSTASTVPIGSTLRSSPRRPRPILRTPDTTACPSAWRRGSRPPTRHRRPTSLQSRRCLYRCLVSLNSGIVRLVFAW
jgi:hypothetical protein